MNEEERALGIAIVDPGLPPGDVRRYGADPTGRADSRAAFAAASRLRSGAAIPVGRFYFGEGPLQHVGKLVWRGAGTASVIIADGPCLEVADGSDSLIEAVSFENRSTPWLVRRSGTPGRRDATTVQRSDGDDGYQPTANDHDFYETLDDRQKFEQIGPMIYFRGNAARVVIRHVRGRFLTIRLHGVVESRVEDCEFRGGKHFASAAAIYFDGHAPYQRGRDNRALRNRVTFASFCGIAVNENDDFLIADNECSHCGESGIKTQQFDGRLPTGVSYRGRILRNRCDSNHFDGIDAMSLYPQRGDGGSDSEVTAHLIQDNECRENDGAGINTDGRGNRILRNRLVRNGTFGLWGIGLSGSLVAYNIAEDNNQKRDRYFAELMISGAAGGSTIAYNQIRSGAGQNSFAIATCQGNEAPNAIIGNRARGSRFYFGRRSVGNSLDDNWSSLR